MVAQTYKIMNGLAPEYLTNYLNIIDNRVYKTRASEHNNIKRFATRTENFKQSIFKQTNNPAGGKFLSRLRLKFSHLNEHKFRCNFKDALSPMYDCDYKTKTTHHFFLHCPFFAINRQKLLNDFDALKIDLPLRNLRMNYC